MHGIFIARPRGLVVGRDTNQPVVIELLFVNGDERGELGGAGRAELESVTPPAGRVMRSRTGSKLRDERPDFLRDPRLALPGVDRGRRVPRVVVAPARRMPG
jgi:hypothetical protein